MPRLSETRMACIAGTTYVNVKTEMNNTFTAIRYTRIPLLTTTYTTCIKDFECMPV